MNPSSCGGSYVRIYSSSMGYVRVWNLKLESRRRLTTRRSTGQNLGRSIYMSHALACIVRVHDLAISSKPLTLHRSGNIFAPMHSLARQVSTCIKNSDALHILIYKYSTSFGIFSKAHKVKIVMWLCYIQIPIQGSACLVITI